MLPELTTGAKRCCVEEPIQANDTRNFRLHLAHQEAPEGQRKVVYVSPYQCTQGSSGWSSYGMAQKVLALGRHQCTQPVEKLHV